MKKILLILVAVIGFGIAANANERYKCTPTVRITYQYTTDYGEVLKTVDGGTVKITPITVCASSIEDARHQAKDECDRMCSRRDGRSLGSATVDGKKCTMYELRETYNIDVTPYNQNC